MKKRLFCHLILLLFSSSWSTIKCESVSNELAESKSKFLRTFGSNFKFLFYERKHEQSNDMRE